MVLNVGLAPLAFRTFIPPSMPTRRYPAPAPTNEAYAKLLWRNHWKHLDPQSGPLTVGELMK
jgi:hypothetical protein